MKQPRRRMCREKPCNNSQHCCIAPRRSFSSLMATKPHTRMETLPASSPSSSQRRTCGFNHPWRLAHLFGREAHKRWQSMGHAVDGCSTDHCWQGSQSWSMASSVISQEDGKGGSDNVTLDGTFPPASDSKSLAHQQEHDAESQAAVDRRRAKRQNRGAWGAGWSWSWSTHQAPASVWTWSEDEEITAQAEAAQASSSAHAMVSHLQPPLTHLQPSLKMSPTQPRLQKQ